MFSYNDEATEEIIIPRNINTSEIQLGGAPRSIKFHCYVMLDAESTYSGDLDRLISFYENNYNGNQFDMKKATNTKKRDIHITILDFDIELSDNNIRQLSNNYYKLSDFIDMSNSNQRNKGVDMRKFGRFRIDLFGKLQAIVDKSIRDHFRGLPPETTASMYPSKYDKKGPFLAVILRTDLAFMKLIVPDVKNKIYNYFSTNSNGSKITWSKFFDDPMNIIFHLSLGREKTQNTPVTSNRNISPKTAKNYSLSPSILNRHPNLVRIEKTSNVELL
tara:strand:+ start:1902 stop:2726 length:825 start_codon:yes stop_codon:yes gene_type:complete